MHVPGPNRISAALRVAQGPSRVMPTYAHAQVLPVLAPFVASIGYCEGHLPRLGACDAYRRIAAACEPRSR